MSSEEFVSSVEKLSRAVGASTRALRRWDALHDDFPAKTSKGYDVAATIEFAKRHQLGPYANNQTQQINGNGSRRPTLTDARLLLTVAKTERERIAKRMDEIELGKVTDQIVLLDDVVLTFSRIAATVQAVLLQLEDAADRELPQSLPSPAAWPDVRQRVIAGVGKLGTLAVSCVEELIKGANDDESELD